MTSERYLEPESTRLSAAAPPLPSPADAPRDDLFATSRKYAQALLEHLDVIGVTKRVGDGSVRALHETADCESGARV